MWKAHHYNDHDICKRLCEWLDECVDKIHEVTFVTPADVTRKASDKFKKQLVLGMIGLWSKQTPQYAWHVTDSVNEDDRVGQIFKTRRVGGTLRLYTRT